MKLMERAQDVRTIHKLLTGAEAVANEQGESVPGAEHLLLSALALPDGSARRAFERVGADPQGLGPAIERQYAQALRGIGIEPPAAPELDTVPDDQADQGAGVFRSTASARSVFQAASALARSEPSKGLIGAHVVLAVTDLEHGTAARALTAMGIDRAALAAAAHEEVRRHSR